MGWTALHVSYNQYEVLTVPGARGLEIFTLGDDLLNVAGPHTLVGFCGVHTGSVRARLRLLRGPGSEAGWDAIAETTLWCPSGLLQVVGLMSGAPEGLGDVPVPRGLIRVRLHARNRIHEVDRTDADPDEEHEIHVWAVAEETPWRTVRAAEGAREREQRTAEAASWAMRSLVPRPSSRPAILPPVPIDPYEDDSGLPRVAVVRHRATPIDLPVGVLPAGDLEVRLDRVDAETITWSWAPAAEPIFPVPLTTLPDQEPSRVRVTPGPDDGYTLRHEGVLGRHAVALGLIWDHLLDAPGSYPWVAELRDQAAEATARAEEASRLRAQREAERWGGSPPSERLRALRGNAQSLARMDRPLVDRILALPAARQREIAVWAAREAMRVAGLDRVAWITDALAEAEAGRPPAFLRDGGPAAFDRLLSDPEVPHTTIPVRPHPSSAFLSGGVRYGDLPAGLSGGRRPEAAGMLQQAVAFPALLALANEDPPAAAIDAVRDAALAHGDDREAFLARVPVGGQTQ